MSDAHRATCPRCGGPLSADDPAALMGSIVSTASVCGGPLSADDPAGLCPRCLLSGTQGDKTGIPPVSPSSPGRARRKLTLASAVAVFGAILLGNLWFGNRRGQQTADAVAHINLGIALGNQGKLEEAIAAYREAIRLKPDYADAHNNLGIALGKQGKLEEAVAEFRTAIRLKPDYADAHATLGVALVAQGKVDDAIAELRAAIRLKPNTVQWKMGKIAASPCQTVSPLMVT